MIQRVASLEPGRNNFMCRLLGQNGAEAVSSSVFCKVYQGDTPVFTKYFIVLPHEK